MICPINSSKHDDIQLPKKARKQEFITFEKLEQGKD